MIFPFLPLPGVGGGTIASKVIAKPAAAIARRIGRALIVNSSNWFRKKFGGLKAFLNKNKDLVSFGLQTIGMLLMLTKIPPLMAIGSGMVIAGGLMTGDWKTTLVMLGIGLVGFGHVAGSLNLSWLASALSHLGRASMFLSSAGFFLDGFKRLRRGDISTGLESMAMGLLGLSEGPFGVMTRGLLRMMASGMFVSSGALEIKKGNVVYGALSVGFGLVIGRVGRIEYKYGRVGGEVDAFLRERVYKGVAGEEAGRVEVRAKRRILRKIARLGGKIFKRIGRSFKGIGRFGRRILSRAGKIGDIIVKGIGKVGKAIKRFFIKGIQKVGGIFVRGIGEIRQSGERAVRLSVRGERYFIERLARRYRSFVARTTDGILKWFFGKGKRVVVDTNSIRGGFKFVDAVVLEKGKGGVYVDVYDVKTRALPLEDIGEKALNRYLNRDIPKLGSVGARNLEGAFSKVDRRLWRVFRNARIRKRTLVIIDGANKVVTPRSLEKKARILSKILRRSRRYGVRIKSITNYLGPAVGKPFVRKSRKVERSIRKVFGRIRSRLRRIRSGVIRRLFKRPSRLRWYRSSVKRTLRRSLRRTRNRIRGRTFLRRVRPKISRRYASFRRSISRWYRRRRSWISRKYRSFRRSISRWFRSFFGRRR